MMTNNPIPKKITIFGAEGTGKTTISKLLAQSLGYDVRSSGNMMRETAKEYGMDIYDFGRFLQENLHIDRELDQKIARYGNENEQFIFESRLAWHWIPDAFHILLTASESVRMGRIASRENFTIEEAREMTLEREATNISRYAALYPEIEFPPKHDRFHLSVDTDQLSPDEIVAYILDHFA